MDQLPSKSLNQLERQVVESFTRLNDFSVERTARETGQDPDAVSSILRRTDVSQALALTLLASSKDRVREMRDSTLLALWQLANWDPKDAFTNEGLMLSIPDMPLALRRAVKGWKQTRYGLEVTFTDRDAILRFLAQHLIKLSEAEEAQKGEEPTKYVELEQDSEADLQAED